MNAMEAYEYADILQARFPKGEAAIATDAELSYSYALNILKAAFPEGEAFTSIMGKVGFTSITSKKLTFGICTIYCGKK